MPVSSPKKTRRACKGLYEHIAEALRPLAVPIADLTQDPANARLHPPKNVEGIAASLRVYGQRKPVVVNKRTGTIEAGNGTLEAARTLGWGHIAAVYVDDDAATAAGFSISDNRTAELATWDTVALDKLLREVSTGNDPQLDAMLEELRAENPVAEPLPEPGAGGDDFDATPETGPTRTKAGELWVIGGVHRLLVGDCTVAENVARLMGGEKAGLCFTSPPYAQQRDYGQKITDWNALMFGAFGCLPMADDGQVLVNLGLIHRDGEWVPYWEEWIAWMREQGWRRFGWYVWDQGSGLPGDWCGRLAPSFEFLWHFNRDSIRPEKFIDTKPESQARGKAKKPGDTAMRGADGVVKAISSPEKAGQLTKIPDNVLRITRHMANDVARQGHPATFPIELPSFVIQCWPADIYDPFLGSGTTLIAAHRLNRRCYGCEIEPRYADVILRRAEAESLKVERMAVE
jgi:DNA modification methylase